MTRSARLALVALVVGLLSSASFAAAAHVTSDVELTAEQEALLKLAAKQGWATVPTAGDSGSTARKLTQTQTVTVANNPPPATDPVYTATMEELVLPHGYPLEQHPVITEDGFILNMYRIPAGVQRNTQRNVSKPIIFLQHGITLSSACYVLQSKNESMAFVLADAGFDVWLGNTRGNTFSRGHLTLRDWMPQFWYTSIDTHALKDLPAMIDYVLSKTRAKKMAFVGHSQGCTLMLLLLAHLDKYNDKISVVFHMGAVAFPKNIKSVYLKRAGELRQDQILKQLAIGEFLTTRFSAPFTTPYCQNWPLTITCAQVTNYAFYGPSQYVTLDDIWLLDPSWPASVASRNIEHWAQMIRLNETRLQMYDYGTDCSSKTRPFFESCNQLKYGALRPPAYNLTRIRAPQYWLAGALDVMSVPQDVELQQKLIPKSAQAGMSVYPGYGHMDFVWDRNAVHIQKIAEVAFRFSPGTY